MTMIYDKTKECVICGAQGEFGWILSTNKFGLPDLDLRPPEMYRSTINLWIQRCHGCGFCAPDISEKGVLIKTVKRLFDKTNTSTSLTTLPFSRLPTHFCAMQSNKKRWQNIMLQQYQVCMRPGAAMTPE